MDWFRKRNKKRRLQKWWDEEVVRQKNIEKAKESLRKDVFTSADAAGRWLQSKGFEVIGGGYYGSVYAHPASNKVIKLIPRPGDDGWLDYVLWAGKEGYGGTFAPLIHSYKEISIKTKTSKNWKYIYPVSKRESFGIAIMERLDKTLTKVDNKDKVALAQPLIDFALSKENPVAMELLDSMYSGAAIFIKKVRKQFGGVGRFDLHGANIMLRKDGSLVLTDPIADMKREAKLPTRLRAGDFTPALVVTIKGLIYGRDCVRFA